MRLTGEYIFYADVYFLQNLLIKVTVLYLALYLNKQNYRVHPIRILLGATFGTLLEITGLLWGGDFSFLMGVVHLLEIPLIMFFLFKTKEWKLWIHVTVSAWFFVLVVNGVVEAIWNCFGETGHFMGLVLLSCLMVRIGTKYVLQYQRIQKGIYPVQLLHKGNKISGRGFYDSGNCLKDPYTGKGVHIISKELAFKLQISKENAVLISYSSLGNGNGLMKVYYLEKIRIYTRTEVMELMHTPVGIAEDDIVLKEYNLILNENVW